MNELIDQQDLGLVRTGRRIATKESGEGVDRPPGVGIVIPDTHLIDGPRRRPIAVMSGAEARPVARDTVNLAACRAFHFLVVHENKGSTSLVQVSAYLIAQFGVLESPGIRVVEPLQERWGQPRRPADLGALFQSAGPLTLYLGSRPKIRMGTFMSSRLMEEVR